VMECLEKDRAHRYDNAALFAQDIQRHLQNLPIAARPPNAAYRARKFMRRHRGPLFAVTAVAVGLVLGMVAQNFFRRQGGTFNASRTAGQNGAEPPIKNVEAFNLYVTGKFFFSKWTQEAVDSAVNYLNQAIALEPDFALAHAALAEARTTGLYFTNKP